MLLRSPVELHHRRLTNFFFLVSTSHILYNQSSLGVRVCYEVCSGIPSPLVARSHGSSSTILINEGIKITCPIITKPKYDIQKLQSPLARQQLGEKRGEREREIHVLDLGLYSNLGSSFSRVCTLDFKHKDKRKMENSFNALPNNEF